MNTAPSPEATFQSYAVQRTGADSWRELVRTYISTGVRSTSGVDRMKHDYADGPFAAGSFRCV